MLKRHNFNLLPTLRELLATRSVSRTAENLGVTQSAVSTALARLREDFGNELLVLQGRRYELTERARELQPTINRLCIDLDEIFQQRSFDPQRATRRFVIATADYTVMLLAPEIVTLLIERQVNATLQFVDVAPHSFDDLVLGKIDAMIVPSDTVDAATYPTLDRRHLFNDEAVIIARRDHGRKLPMTQRDYEQSRHVTFQIASSITTPHERVTILNEYKQRKGIIVVQQFAALPALVERTDCLAVLHRRLAERLSLKYDIALLAAPFASIRLDIMMFLRVEAGKDPAITWLQTLIDDAVRVIDKRT